MRARMKRGEGGRKGELMMKMKMKMMRIRRMRMRMKKNRVMRTWTLPRPESSRRRGASLRGSGARAFGIVCVSGGNSSKNRTRGGSQPRKTNRDRGRGGDDDLMND